jgi:hypothetical protein
MVQGRKLKHESKTFKNVVILCSEALHHTDFNSQHPRHTIVKTKLVGLMPPGSFSTGRPLSELAPVT